CDRVLWLERGELLMDGPTDEVIKAYEKETGK
ncbi:ABC transporter ATP-binding protein, partial [Streptomyces kronopolitis]